MKIPLTAARALLLHSQGLSSPLTASVSKQDVLSAIRRMGLLQIDTISVVARSPYLVLWSRLGAYEMRWLDELLAEGALFEYWAHAACFLPIEHYGLYRRRMLEIAATQAEGRGASEIAQQVLEHIKERGAVRSAHFTRAEGKAGTWWDWKPEKIALERLFNAGVLMIARREGFQRVYDLQERVLPEWDDRLAPTREHGVRELTLQAIQSLGVATAPWIAAYFPDLLRRRHGAAEVAALLNALTTEGVLTQGEVEEVKAPAFLLTESLPTLERIMAGTLTPSRTALLSPFDPIVSDRARAKALFGFDYRIETYTPAEKRRYGYFSLPILHRNALIGRLDAKAHRKEGRFEVKSIHLEPGAEVTEELIQALAETLSACARWHRTPEVTVQRSDPADLTPQLTAALQEPIQGGGPR